MLLMNHVSLNIFHFSLERKRITCGSFYSRRFLLFLKIAFVLNFPLSPLSSSFVSDVFTSLCFPRSDSLRWGFGELNDKETHFTRPEATVDSYAVD